MGINGMIANFSSICTYSSAQKWLNGVFYKTVLHDCEQKRPPVLCYFLCTIEIQTSCVHSTYPKIVRQVETDLQSTLCTSATIVDNNVSEFEKSIHIHASQ